MSPKETYVELITVGEGLVVAPDVVGQTDHPVAALEECKAVVFVELNGLPLLEAEAFEVVLIDPDVDVDVQAAQPGSAEFMTETVTLLVTAIVRFASAERLADCAIPETIPVPEGAVPLVNTPPLVLLAKGIREVLAGSDKVTTVINLEVTSNIEHLSSPQVAVLMSTFG